MFSFMHKGDGFGIALSEVVEVECDTLYAYEEAINLIENEEYKEQLECFRKDHISYITDISNLLREHEFEPSVEPQMTHKPPLKGKRDFKNFMGDLSILRAIRNDEVKNNMIYEWLTTLSDIWPDSHKILDKAFAKEKTHNDWFNNIFKRALRSKFY